jgi:hypothetical protein
MTRFWYADICNFLNVQRIPINALDVYPLLPAFWDTAMHSSAFEQACSASESAVATQFLNKVAPDIGASLDERDLCVIIWMRVNDFGNKEFHINIPPADCDALSFPSFYVFFYAYYFRYLKNSNVKPDLNDFIDLTNCLAVPYCERYYCENTFASILRDYVRGRIPPTAFHLIKKLHQKGLIAAEIYQAQRENKAKLGRTALLLEHTEVFNLTEMRSQII